MQKIYRIFISSCKRLLENERRILSDAILANGHLPVQMEYNFAGSNIEYSIDIDKKKIEEADCVIFILSYLYGEKIGNKIGDKKLCPLLGQKATLQNCDLCYDPNGCQLSFTQFEYEYALLLGKPIIVIWNEKYKNINDFKTANESYANSCGEDCESAFYEGRNKNEKFVSRVTIQHAFPYKDESKFSSNCAAAMTLAIKLINEREQNGIVEHGLIPYQHYHYIKESEASICLQLQKLRQNVVESVFRDQQHALEALEEDVSSIYYGSDGKIKKIKVLATRGDSFIRMGHDWCRFILDDEFKSNEEIPVEFILGNEQNEELVGGRYFAFKKKNPTSTDDFEKFKARYKEEMEQVHSVILKYKRKHECTLLLHNEERLPFRMVFIGKYLYLSAFLNEKKAAVTPVMKIPYSSTLYQVCEEYYNWIKASSIQHPDELLIMSKAEA